MEARHIKPALTALLALGLLGLLGTADASSIYRWTAPDGTVSYGSSPPPGVDAERVRGAPGPATPGRRSDEQQDAEAASAEPVEASEGQAAGNGGGETQRERECARARENLEVLENPAVRRIQTDGGEAQPLTEEMREEMLRETREFYDEWCR